MPSIRPALFAVATGLCLALSAHANHLATAQNIEEYVVEDMPQQYAWRHGAGLGLALSPDYDQRIQTAGGFFQFVDLSLNLTSSWADDRLLFGETWDLDSSLFIVGYAADELTLGLGLSQNHQETDGLFDLELDSFTLDLFGTKGLGRGFALTVFFSYIHSELDGDDFLIDVGGDLAAGEIESDSVDRIGGGVLLSHQCRWRDLVIVASTGIASMNARNASELFDSEYASWNSLLELTHPIVGALSGSLYGSYNHLLDAPALTQRDEDVGAVGLELDYALSAACSLRLGYETDVAYENYEGHRVNLGVTLSW